MTYDALFYLNYVGNCADYHLHLLTFTLKQKPVANGVLLLSVWAFCPKNFITKFVYNSNINSVSSHVDQRETKRIRCTRKSIPPMKLIERVSFSWSYDQDQHTLHKCIILSQN